MKRILTIMLLLGFAQLAGAQHTLTAVIKDADTKEPLPGATALLAGTSNGAQSNEKGIVSIKDIPSGKQVIIFRFMGYQEKTDTIVFPQQEALLTISLERAGREIEEVMISSTRSNRSIKDIPTRVEFINGEELEEKGNMKPGDIRMMLNESTGIQTQQVSATSANSSIRIQGLDGRYTQILKDGFPLYAGFSGGLGLLQTPPPDLKQVEVIKGSSSTLYGGGAIAGLVNLISKVPTDNRELRFLVNGTSAGGLDLSGYYGQRFEKVGVTVFASRNSNRAYDPSNTGFTAIPKFERYVLNPRLFLYFNANTKLNAGISFTTEDRTGGDILYIKGQGNDVHSYFEKNNSQRVSTQLAFEHQFTDNSSVAIKNSVNNFNRTIRIPGYVFDGKQWSSYTEATYHRGQENLEWVMGLNVYTDNFRETPTDTVPRRNYDQRTMGAFIQNTWKTSNWLQLETGLRGDYVADYGLVLLPRLSALLKISPKVSSRIGGGLGYKTPTIFTEETERIQYQGVLPVSSDANKLERSYGANVDVNYHTSFFDDKFSFSFNQLFFYTRINDPLLLTNAAAHLFRLENAAGYIKTRGWETNVKIGYGDFKLYLGYTFTDAQLNNNGRIMENPLTARHRLNNVLMYEKEEKWKVGLEAYYYSQQVLNDGSTGKPYWICGFMAEKLWERFSLFVNFENMLDTRQTRFDTIYTGTVTHPVFRDIYAPLDGFVVNGGLKLKL